MKALTEATNADLDHRTLPLPELLHSHLRLSTRNRAPSHGKHVHAFVIKSGLRCASILNAILDMYCKCGSLLDAHQLFEATPHRDPVFWSTILAAHAQSENPRCALSLLPTMIFVDRVEPDDYIYSTLAKACTRLADLRLGRQVHARFVSSPFAADDVVKSSLVDMYSKSGAVDEARRVFDSIITRNPICWTAMVSGYASNNRYSDAVGLFRMMPDKQLLTWTALISGFVRGNDNVSAVRMFLEMRRESVEIDDSFVLSSVVSAASNMAALELGRQIHGLVIVLGYETGTFVGNALVDMYAKCSNITAARAVFESILAQDIFSWTTMIVGEAQHGHAAEAFALFEKMISSGVMPNEVTFVGLIYACSHGGLVEKGRHFFNSMVKVYGIKRSLQHYTCLLDLLSRSGLLGEAEDVIRTMPFEPDEAAWAALLSACKRHGDMVMSIRVADHLLSLKPKDPSTYILLSNTYAAAGRWEHVAGMRKMMTTIDVRKEPGYSWVELGKESYIFTAGEVLHPLRDEILQLLQELVVEMKKRGYYPDTSSVLHDLEEHEKEQQLYLHSERLAVALGLLKRVQGMVIRVVKNLRVFNRVPSEASWTCISCFPVV
ncbi:hypothetical protein Taro_052005 [Colocasia esculenta]|uniref:DYW domain-containing protein n=1 Tax=Colocasia esculenta TaxID=4460 RepID=A0A843XIQ0_COLES|nr:hypothetical protein [Colocasia esculenta]